MARVLIIDDDRIIRKIVEVHLTKLGLEIITASSGEEGLEKVKSNKPDIVVTDKLMPGMDGIEVTRRLRSLPATAQIPILILTGEAELEDKVAAFEAGADDYLGKPFEAAELAARVMALLRRTQALKAALSTSPAESEDAKIIAVHSLRGGNGCSSLAVNLSIALQNLWQKHILLTDMVFSAGQIALMLNSPVKYTWTDLAEYTPEDLDEDVVNSIKGHHESKVDFIAAPANPADAEKIGDELVTRAFDLVLPQYDYIVADLAHNFSSLTLEVLDKAETILLMLAPEMASVRTAAIALDTYSKLGYSQDDIKLILNWTFERDGLPSKKIEAALNHPISLILPFAPKQFVGAINRGIPVIYGNPENAITLLMEDFAYKLSKESHQNRQPESPSFSWQRLNKRLDLFKDKTEKGGRKKSSLLSFA